MSFFVSSIKEAVRLARSGQWIKYIINEITVEHCLSSPTLNSPLSEGLAASFFTASFTYTLTPP